MASPSRVGVQPDGGVIALGHNQGQTKTLLVRYLADGTSDPAFGDGGVVTLHYGADMAIQQDGRILVVGVPFQDGDADLVRLLTDGRPDPSFGVDGAVTVDTVGDPQLAYSAVSGEPDGSIVLAGSGSVAGRPAVAIARLASDGSPDPSFSGDGLSMFTEEATSVEALEVAVEADRSIAALATARTADSSLHAALIRLTADGSVDEGFGDGGRAVIDLNDYGAASSLLRAPSGAYLVPYSSCSLTTFHSACSREVARVGADGRVDGSFGGAAAVGSGTYTGYAQTRSGDVLAVGSDRPPGADRDVALARLTTDWRPVRSFGREGVSRADLRLGLDVGEVVTEAPDGRIVVLGTRSRWTPTGEVRPGLVVARFLSAPSPADADADGFRDREDRCRLRHGKRHAGCPAIRRQIRITVRAPRLGGLLTATSPPGADECAAHMPVKVYRARNGPDRLVARARTNRDGEWRVRAPDHRARVYALAPRRTVAKLGSCAVARSRTLENG